MRIQTNVESLNAYRNLNNTNRSMSNSMEKLSSGFRINRAADDAAGLAISEKMRGQVRGLDQAARNAQDANSMIQTAEGALNESHEILQRMRELSVQSATDTNTDADRQEIQSEVDELAAELSRIAENTEFNEQKLIDGSLESVFHIGANEGQNIELGVADMSADALGVSGAGEGDATFDLSDDDINGITDAGSLQVDGSHEVALTDGENNLEAVEFDSIQDIDGFNDGVKHGLANEDGDIVAVGDRSGENYVLLEEAVAEADLERDGTVAGDGTVDDFNTATDMITFDESVISGDVTIDASVDNDGNLDAAIAAADIDAVGTIETTGLDSGTHTIEGDSGDPGDTDIATYLDDVDFSTEATDDDLVDLVDQIILDKDDNVVAVSFEPDTDSVLGPDGTDAGQGEFYHIDDLDFESDTLDGGDYSGVIDEDAEMVLDSANLEDGDELEVSAEGGIDVSSQEAADAAITTINEAIETVSTQRAELGAVQNRLDHTIANLEVASENLQAAESRIRDVDMAQEMTEFSKQQILEQAGTAMLAQANQAPQSVLQLLG